MNKDNNVYTVDGAGVTLTAAQVEKLVAEHRTRQQPQPVVGQMYRHKNTTDAEPHKGDYAVMRYVGLEQWDWRKSGESQWRKDLGSFSHLTCARWVTEGTWVPYNPPTWTPQVGDWVQHREQPWPKARRVTSVDLTEGRVQVGSYITWGCKAWPTLRPATDAEIAEAKRSGWVAGDHYTVLDSYTVQGAR